MIYNESTTYQAMQLGIKLVLKGKCMALKGHIKKQDRSKVHEVNFQFKRPEKNLKLNTD